MNNAIDAETAYLFSHDWFTWDRTEEEGGEYLDRADALIEKYGWPLVFERWFDYLVTYCKTPHGQWLVLPTYFGGMEVKIIPFPILIDFLRISIR